jgi:hypothetical protein
MLAIACAAQRTIAVRPEVRPNAWPELATSVDLDQVRELLQAHIPGMTGDGVIVEPVASVAAVEAASVRRLANCRTCPQVPFGHADKQWTLFAQRIQPGDTLVFVRNSKRAWASLMGVEGYALISKGRFVDVFVTLMS